MAFNLFYKYDLYFKCAFLEFPLCKCRRFAQKFVAMNPIFISFSIALISAFLHIWLICATIIRGLGGGFSESLPLSIMSLIFIALHFWAYETMRGIACCGKK